MTNFLFPYRKFQPLLTHPPHLSALPSPLPPSCHIPQDCLLLLPLHPSVTPTPNTPPTLPHSLHHPITRTLHLTTPLTNTPQATQLQSIKHLLIFIPLQTPKDAVSNTLLTSPERLKDRLFALSDVASTRQLPSFLPGPRTPCTEILKETAGWRRDRLRTANQAEKCVQRSLHIRRSGISYGGLCER